MCILLSVCTRPEERAEEDIRIIFEELLHVKAFAQLSHAVKRELASCVAIDSYQGKSGHVCKWCTVHCVWGCAVLVGRCREGGVYVCKCVCMWLSVGLCA